MKRLLSQKNQKQSFLDEQYVHIEFDWTSSAFWNQDGHNIPLKWFPWDKKNYIHRQIKKGFEAVEYVFNSQPVPYTSSEINEGFYASAYVEEEKIKLAYMLKREFPDWTVVTQYGYDNINKKYKKLIMTTDVNITEIINQLRVKCPIGSSLLIIEER